MKNNIAAANILTTKCVMFDEYGKPITLTINARGVLAAVDNAAFVKVVEDFTEEEIAIVETFSPFCVPYTVGTYRWDYDREEYITFEEELNRLYETWKVLGVRR